MLYPIITENGVVQSLMLKLGIVIAIKNQNIKILIHVKTAEDTQNNMKQYCFQYLKYGFRLKSHSC